MSQTIELGALVLAEGRLLVVSDGTGGAWTLIGGVLRPEHPDTETAMDEMLAEFGISAPAIEEDFLETFFFGDGGSRLVYNLYVPSEWTGEPRATCGKQLKWVEPADIARLDMDPRIRNALLQTFGLKDRPDNDLFALDSMRAALADSSEELAAIRLEPGGTSHPRSPLDGEFEDLITARWSNADLDPHTRGLIDFALSAALGSSGARTAAAIERARAHGATASELEEALRMVALFAGHPAATGAAAELRRAIERETGEARA